MTTNREAQSSNVNTQLISILLIALGMVFFNVTGLDVGRDEGVHAFAAKNLAFSGRYTLNLVTDAYDFDRRIAVGPTVIVPTALLFKVFGVSLYTIRAIPAFYFLLFILAFYFLIKREFGKPTAFLTCLLILSSQWPFWRSEALFNPIYRTLTGESAGLFFLTLSLLFWRKSYLSAFILGLAILTKYQFALAIPPFLLMQFGLPAQAGAIPNGTIPNRVVPGVFKKFCGTLLLFLVTLSPLFFWFGLQFVLLGFEQFLSQMSSYKNFADQTVSFSFLRVKQNIIDKWAELNPPALKIFFTLPALVYGALSFWQGTKSRVQNQKFSSANLQLFFVLFPTIWMVWYIFSRGYIRYEIPGLYFSLIFLADILIRARKSELKLFLFPMFLVLVLYGFYINYREAKVVEPKNAQNMAEYVLANTSQGNILTGELDYAVDLFLYSRPPLFHAFAGARQKASLDENFVYSTSDNYSYIISKDSDPTFENLLKVDDWQFVKKFGDLSLYKFVDCGCGVH